MLIPGLVRDRALTDGSIPPNTNRYAASIAATGFGLTALAIAADHHWRSEVELRARARDTLHFFAYQAPGKNGFFYHWLDAQTGERVRDSEVSSIDSGTSCSGSADCESSGLNPTRRFRRLRTRFIERWILPGFWISAGSCLMAGDRMWGC